MRTLTVEGTVSSTAAKLRMLEIPAATSRSAATCAAGAGVATTPIDTWQRRTIAASSVTGRTSMSPISRPHLGGVDVDDPGHRIAPLPEAAVAGERLTEVPGADDHDRPVMVETELPAELVDQVLDVVADTTHAVGAEVTEVLAHLGGVDPGEISELFRRQVDDTCIE